MNATECQQLLDNHDFEPMTTNNMNEITDIRKGNVKLNYFGVIKGKDIKIQNLKSSRILTGLVNNELKWLLPFLNPNSVNGQVARYKSEVLKDKMVKVQLRKEADLLLNDYIILNRIWKNIESMNLSLQYSSIVMNNIEHLFFLPVVHYNQINSNNSTAIDLLRFKNTSLYNVFPAIIFKPFNSNDSLYDKLKTIIIADKNEDTKTINDIVDLALVLKEKNKGINKNVYTFFKDFLTKYNISVDDLDYKLSSKDTALEYILKQYNDVSKNLFIKLNNFYKQLLYLGMIIVPGLAHNDLHITNIVYNDDNECFSVIDFGRATFDNYTEDVQNGIEEWKNKWAEKNTNTCQFDGEFDIEEYILLNRDFPTKKTRGGKDNIWGDLAGVSLFLFENELINDKLDYWVTSLLFNYDKALGAKKQLEYLQSEWKSITENIKQEYAYIKLSYIWVLTYSYICGTFDISIDNGCLKKRIYDKIHGFNNPTILNTLDPDFENKDWYKFDIRSFDQYNSIGGSPTTKKKSADEFDEGWRKIYKSKDEFRKKYPGKSPPENEKKQSRIQRILKNKS